MDRAISQEVLAERRRIDVSFFSKIIYCTDLQQLVAIVNSLRRMWKNILLIFWRH